MHKFKKGKNMRKGKRAADSAVVPASLNLQPPPPLPLAALPPPAGPSRQNSKNKSGMRRFASKADWWRAVELYFMPVTDAHIASLEASSLPPPPPPPEPAIKSATTHELLASSRRPPGSPAAATRRASLHRSELAAALGVRSADATQLRAQLAAVRSRNHELKVTVRRSLDLKRWDKAKALTTKRAAENQTISTYEQNEAWRVLSWHLQHGARDVPYTPPSGVSEDDFKHDEASKQVVCAVCFDGGSYDHNPLLRCDNCYLSVHKACYGVLRVPLGSWYCQFCRPPRSIKAKGANSSALAAKSTSSKSSRRRMLDMQPHCVLCREPGGALKVAPREDGAGDATHRWVHVPCALWHPDCSFQNVAMMDGVRGVDRALARGGAARCGKCGERGGGTIQCARSGCTERYHPLCAWYSGAHMSITSSGSGADRNVDFKLLCPNHAPGRKGASAAQRAKEQAAMRNRGRRLEFRRRSKQRKVVIQPSQEEVTEDLYEAGRCGVCFRSESVQGNALVRCARCGIQVHESCYGVTAGDDALWTCSRCCSRKHRSKPVSCVLCPRRGGAFKPTVDKKWVHVTCAQWVPEVLILDAKKVEPVDTRAVPKDRFHHRCFLCKQRQGAVLACSHFGCDKRFHVLCGFFAGAHMRKKALRGGVERLVACCPFHTPVMLSRRVAIPDGYVTLWKLKAQLEKAERLVVACAQRERFKRDLFRSDCAIFEAARARVARGVPFAQAMLDVAEARDEAFKLLEDARARGQKLSSTGRSPTTIVIRKDASAAGDGPPKLRVVSLPRISRRVMPLVARPAPGQAPSDGAATAPAAPAAASRPRKRKQPGSSSAARPKETSKINSILANLTSLVSASPSREAKPPPKDTIPAAVAAPKGTVKGQDIRLNRISSLLSNLQSLKNADFKETAGPPSKKQRKNPQAVASPALVVKAAAQPVRKQQPAKQQRPDKLKLRRSKAVKRKQKKGVSVGEFKKKKRDPALAPPNIAPYEIGDKVFVRNRGRVYEAFILDSRGKGSGKGSRRQYLIHFHGWNARYDEWLPAGDVLQLMIRATDRRDMSE